MFLHFIQRNHLATSRTQRQRQVVLFGCSLCGLWNVVLLDLHRRAPAHTTRRSRLRLSSCIVRLLIGLDWHRLRGWLHWLRGARILWLRRRCHGALARMNGKSIAWRSTGSGALRCITESGVCTFVFSIEIPREIMGNESLQKGTIPLGLTLFPPNNGQ